MVNTFKKSFLEIQKEPELAENKTITKQQDVVDREYTDIKQNPHQHRTFLADTEKMLDRDYGTTCAGKNDENESHLRCRFDIPSFF